MKSQRWRCETMTRPALSESDLDHRLHFEELWQPGIQGQNTSATVLDSGIRPTKLSSISMLEEIDFPSDGDPAGNGCRHGTSVYIDKSMIVPSISIGNLKAIGTQIPPPRIPACRAIQYCMQQYPKYRPTNLSIYFEPEECSQANPCQLFSLVNKAVPTGITVVVATGHLGPKTGTITFPGLAEDAITVDSTWRKADVH